MKFWTWSAGRQGTGYRKLLLAHGRTWDAYLLDYPPGSHVPEHRDAVPGKRHHRVNVVLAGDADAFAVAPAQTHFGVYWRRGRVALFRPDVVTHMVQRVASRRIVLSIGWVR